VDARDNLGQTPSIAAMSCGFRNVVAIATLARHGADLNLATYDNETALTYAIVCTSLPAVCLLLAAGADPNWRGADGGTPLRYALDTLSDATEDEMDEVVRLLFEFGATPDMGQHFSDSSLAWALRTRRERVSRRVLSKVTRLSDEQRTEAIQLAEQRGLHSIADQLRGGNSDDR
jgi:ankyrin repeat protein